MVGINRYRVSGLEYQDDAYSDAMDVTPSIPDTQLPDPSSHSEFPYPDMQVYDWEIYQQTSGAGMVLAWTGTAGNTRQFTSGQLVPDATYMVRVTSRNQMSGRSWPTPYLFTVASVGRDEPPGTPLEFSATEAGGSIFLDWQEPSDEFPGTLTYEIRIIPNPQSAFPATDAEKIAAWESATYFFSGATLGTWKAGFSSGVYRFLIKAIDVFGTPSAVPAILDVTSTSDDKAL